MVLTVKQEAFCCSYIENGGNASEAYRTAYNAEKMTPGSVKVAACKLLANPNVTITVKRRREALLVRHELTVDDILNELEEARQIELSASKPNTGSMIAASMGKAKVAGLIKDRAEITGPNGGPVSMSLSVSFVKP